jgi:protein O-GlcNAc transferase
MHTGGGRLLVFARRPSPVQVCWLAYPGTTGMTAMDYRVTDPYLDPPALDGDSYSRAYTERAMRLPETFWCYRPQHPSIEVGPLPGDDGGACDLRMPQQLRKGRRHRSRPLGPRSPGHA